MKMIKARMAAMQDKRSTLEVLLTVFHTYFGKGKSETRKKYVGVCSNGYRIEKKSLILVDAREKSFPMADAYSGGAIMSLSHLT